MAEGSGDIEMDTFGGVGTSDIGDDYGDTITTDDDTVKLPDIPMSHPPRRKSSLTRPGTVFRACEMS